MSNGNPFRKVTVGEKQVIPARAWNELMDVATEHRAGVGMFGSGELGGRSALVLNQSGSDCGLQGVLGITGVIINPTANYSEFITRIALSGTTPDTSSHFGKFAILAEPIANGAIGRAYVVGACPAKVFINDTGDLFADVKHGDLTQLESGPVGSARILFKESGTGSKYAMVKIGVGELPKVPDRTKNYILGYDSTNQMTTWVSTTRVCPE